MGLLIMEVFGKASPLTFMHYRNYTCNSISWRVLKNKKKKKLKNQIQKVGYLMVNGYIRTFWEQEGYHWENISYGGRGEISIKYIGAIWKFTRVKSTSLIFCNHPLSHDPYWWFFFYIHYAAELKKKSTKSKRPSVKSLFGKLFYFKRKKLIVFSFFRMSGVI
jgi:hypothetical protein